MARQQDTRKGKDLTWAWSRTTLSDGSRARSARANFVYRHRGAQRTGQDRAGDCNSEAKGRRRAGPALIAKQCRRKRGIASDWEAGESRETAKESWTRPSATRPRRSPMFSIAKQGKPRRGRASDWEAGESMETAKESWTRPNATRSRRKPRRC